MNDGTALAELVRRAQANDEEARSRLLERAARLVYGRVLRSLKGQQVAEDVAQQALYEAARGLPGLRAPEAFLPWLRRITDHAIADHARDHRRRHAVQEPVPDELPSGEEGADQDIERQEDRRRVQAALAGLRPRSRLALELCYFHELTSREVAYFLGVSDDAARASLARARDELRRRLSSMVAIDTRQTRICYSTTSGPGAFRGPVFGHDSATAQLYLAIYPAGDAVEAAQTAGLNPEEGQRELERLADLHLVVRQAPGWRCTMPVVDETDLELIRLWAQPMADVVTPHLDGLHRQALDLSRQVQGEKAQSTVMAVAMREAAQRPFAALHGQLAAAAPERGVRGRFSAAVSTCEFPPARMLRGAYSASHSEGDGADIFTYYLHPTGTRRPAVEAFLQRFEVSAGLGSAARTLLHQAICGGITQELQTRLADVLNIPADQRPAFWRGLAELGAIDYGGKPVRVLVPVVPLSEWKGYLGSLEAVGVEIAQRVADAADGLRRRAARCSFADCYFADAVLVFVAYAAALIGRDIDEQGWVTAPDEADLSWGVLIAA